jgi:rhodanese-related sulfurtransferase
MLAAARERIVRYEPAEAVERARRGSLIVDLRSQDERERDGVIPGSIHVPRSVLEWRVDQESGFANPALAAGELILVCAHGFSSSLAAASLVDLGREAGDVVGGFQGWCEAGLPVVAAPPRNDGLPGMGGPDLEPAAE